MEIGQYLAKIWTKYDSLVFWSHPVVAKSCVKKMEKMMTMLLMVLTMFICIQYSAAVKCYECTNCDSPTTTTCTGDVCVKASGEAEGVL